MLELPVIESCSGCGACCREQESPPMLLYWLLRPINRDDPDSIRAHQLPEVLKQELLIYRDHLSSGRSHPRGGVCLWFDEFSRGCKHYELRPEICRDFYRGSEECHEWRKQFNIG